MWKRATNEQNNNIEAGRIAFEKRERRKAGRIRQAIKRKVRNNRVGSQSATGIVKATIRIPDRTVKKR